MCDYSLEYTASRPAKVAEKLVTTAFMGSSTRGFAAVGEPNVAVCLRPGTELAFEKPVQFNHSIGFSIFGMRTLEKVARFRQVNVDQPYVHHDALEFPDGQIILLARLCEGQHATVLQLPHEDREGAEKSEKPVLDLVAV